MNTGMQDAINLAWKLALVISGACGESLLDSYSQERSYVGDQVLAAAQRLTVVGTLKNPVVQALRNAAAHLVLGLAPVQHAFADTMTEVTVGYPESPLNGSGRRGHKAGNRFRPALGEASAGKGAAPRFALFAPRGDAADDIAAEFENLVELRGPADQSGVFDLVRPDGYLACSGAESDEIIDYLSSFAPP